MRNVFGHLWSFISSLWNSRWRWVLVVLSFALFVILWTLLLLIIPNDNVAEWLVFGYILVPLYALSIWQVVSEDERELPLSLKVRHSLLSGFNKLLFGLIFLLAYVIFMGSINGEL